MKASRITRLLAIGSLCSIAGCTFDSVSDGAATDVSISALSPCASVTLATGIEHCVQAHEAGTVDQRWDVQSEPWTGAYVQADEPSDNYCGPTAVKNFLAWYGSDEDYAVLGAEMRTNTWYTDEVLGGWSVASALLEMAIKAGTLPSDLRAALARRAPEGYTACIEQGDGNFENIRSSLGAGDQVVYLESRGADQLHWAVVTGVYLVGEIPTVRLANSVDRSVDDFVRDWSLVRVGDRFKRELLASLFGLRPYTMIRWIRSELANGPSCT